MKSQLNNALAFFQVVAIITNLSTFADAKIQLFLYFEIIIEKKVYFCTEL